MRQCPSCRGVTRPDDFFCRQCGAGIRQSSIRKRSQAALTVAAASGLRVIRGAAPSRHAQSYVETLSALKKILYDYLDEDFSYLDPPQRPWFGAALGDGLLVIAPQGISVAEIIIPEPSQAGIVQESLISDGPWLLTLTDGTDLPIDNPITKANQSARAVTDKLTAFFGNRRKPLPTSVQGLAVFPDRFTLDVVNDRHIEAEGSGRTRVINASQVVRVVLTPLQDERLNPELYREWIYSSVLSKTQDHSVSGTWLDPKEQATSKQVCTVFFPRMAEHQPHPPPLRRRDHVAPPPFPRKAADRIPRIAGFFLLAGFAWVSLLGIGSRERLLSPALVGQGSEADLAPAVPRPQGTLRLPEPQRKEVPRTKKTPRRVEPQISNSDVVIKDSETLTKEETGALPAMGNNPTEAEDFTPTESPRREIREIEDQMDRAIRNHTTGEDARVASINR